MIASFEIIPLGVGVSLSSYIAEIIKIVEKSGLEYRLTPMATIVEGDLDSVLNLIKECHQEMLKKAERVITHIAIDDKKEAKNQIVTKIASVEQKLGYSTKK